MESTKFFKTVNLTAILLLFAATSISLISDFGKNRQSAAEESKDSNVRRSECYYVPEDDGRLWHVVNIYSPELSDDNGLTRNCEYLFTKDSVNVTNYFSDEDMFVNK